MIQLQKLSTDMERLMLLLKSETSGLNQKIQSVAEDTAALSPVGFVKLECDGDGRLVDNSMETDPTCGINLELEKLREVEVQCNACQSSVTFCSGCGGRLALFVPGNSTAAPLTSNENTSPAVNHSDGDSKASETPTKIPPPSSTSPPGQDTGSASPTFTATKPEKPSSPPDPPKTWSPPVVGEDKLSDHVCKKIKLSSKGVV